MLLRLRLLCAWGICLPATMAHAQEVPLHQRIDALIAAKAADQQAAAPADDAEFLRRVYLDLVGRIPTTAEAREFLASSQPDKRTGCIDQLLASAEHPRRMQELFHVVLMERRGDDLNWAKYLQTSFASNKPWNQIVRELLSPQPADEVKGASFFLTKRLENYGQNPVDYPGLTRDVARMFLGMDLQCAQCHNHLFVDQYKQQDFQGLFIVFSNTFLSQDTKPPSVAEKLLTRKLEFMSVFDQVKLETGPRIPGLPELEIPSFPQGEEYAVAPDKKTRFPGRPKFSPLAALSDQLTAAENLAFTKNIVNRLWFMMLGRGIVHPLDLHHAGNPPSHPELLELLAKEFAAQKFDMRWLLREIALSQTYQRSSLLPSVGADPPQNLFLVAEEKRLSAEQLLTSVLVATGTKDAAKLAEAATADPTDPKNDAMRGKFVKAYANPPGEPETEFAPSLQAALLTLNDGGLLEYLNPQANNLVERLTKLESPQALAEELYLSVLTRRPAPEEQAEVSDYLARHADRRTIAIGHLAWALLSSTEFCVNH